MKTIATVDSHHKVLKAWAEYRQSLEKAPRLITLDHHTDTSPPFRNHIKRNHKSEFFSEVQTQLLKSLDFNNLNSVDKAINKLNNDEHIVTAIKSDIISSAFVIAHNAANTNANIFKEHKIACRNIEQHDEALESSLLKQKISSFDKLLGSLNKAPLLSEPYILDIDLDYLNTFKSVSPSDPHLFKKMVKNAGLITIATEPEYVEHCALDSGLSSEYLLDELHKNFLL